MKRSDIVRLAYEAGCPDIIVSREWFRFARLIAAAEREACAKVCESAGSLPDAGPIYCAFAIRERGAP